MTVAVEVPWSNTSLYISLILSLPDVILGSTKCARVVAARHVAECFGNGRNDRQRVAAETEAALSHPSVTKSPTKTLGHTGNGRQVVRIVRSGRNSKDSSSDRFLVASQVTIYTADTDIRAVCKAKFS